MKTYKIIYTETVVHVFYVDADSKEEAENIFDEGTRYGEYDFSDGEISDIEIRVEEEE